MFLYFNKLQKTLKKSPNCIKCASGQGVICRFTRYCVCTRYSQIIVLTAAAEFPPVEIRAADLTSGASETLLRLHRLQFEFFIRRASMTVIRYEPWSLVNRLQKD